MIQERLILSPGFLLGLAILAGNDFLWKAHYHNWLTGKLSDFAGLWSITLLTFAIVKIRPRWVILFWAISFLFWKSLYSQPLIDSWNQTGLPTIGRVVDLTDLTAIFILPIAFIYARKRQRLASLKLAWILRRAAILSTLSLSLFLFTATQFVGDHVCCDGNYEFKMSKAKFLDQLSKTTAHDISYSEKMSDKNGEWYSFYLQGNYCEKGVHVNIQLREQDSMTYVRIAYIYYNCKQGSDDSFVQQRFEKEIIEPIKVASVKSVP